MGNTPTAKGISLPFDTFNEVVAARHRLTPDELEAFRNYFFIASCDLKISDWRAGSAAFYAAVNGAWAPDADLNQIARARSTTRGGRNVDARVNDAVSTKQGVEMHQNNNNNMQPPAKTVADSRKSVAKTPKFPTPNGPGDVGSAG